MKTSPTIESGIRILPDSVASRIAAGEVVERPASVLKELLENAVDAGARRVEIEAEKAGTRLLRVRDDGSGMAPEDCRLALQRHATSKIRDLSDLERLESYGFRGEALYAIAAVSRLSLTSCRPGARAWTLDAEGGRVTAEHEAPPAPGTAVEVRDLFYNTPARLKFLKSEATEKARLTRGVEEAALARTELTFAYSLDARESLRLPSLGPLSPECLRSRVGDIFGLDFLKNLILVQAEKGPLRLLAFLSRPESMAAGRHSQYIFVNRRPVQNKTLQQALYRAYPSRQGRHPACVLFLDLPPGEVDVNVHPQKREVRFKSESAVFELLSGAFERELGGARRPTPIFQPAVAPRRYGAGPRTSELREAIQAYRARGSQDLPPELPEAGPAEAQKPAPSQSQFHGDTSAARRPTWYLPPFRFLGQVEKAYLVFEARGGLLLVDQHAAAERVVFERYLEECLQGSPRVQRLMLPLTAEFPPSLAQKILEMKDWLQSAGFEIASLGKGTLAVHAVPAVFDLDAAAVRDLFEKVAGAVDPSRSGEEARRETVAAWACKKAVKAHDRLGPEEAQRLIEDLRACRNSFECPHGRPALLNLNRDELARRFGRPGPPPL